MSITITSSETLENIDAIDNYYLVPKNDLYHLCKAILDNILFRSGSGWLSDYSGLSLSNVAKDLASHWKDANTQVNDYPDCEGKTVSISDYRVGMHPENVPEWDSGTELVYILKSDIQTILEHLRFCGDSSSISGTLRDLAEAVYSLGWLDPNPLMLTGSYEEDFDIYSSRSPDYTGTYLGVNISEVYSSAIVSFYVNETNYYIDIPISFYNETSGTWNISDNKNIDYTITSIDMGSTHLQLNVKANASGYTYGMDDMNVRVEVTTYSSNDQEKVETLTGSNSFYITTTSSS